MCNNDNSSNNIVYTRTVWAGREGRPVRGEWGEGTGVYYNCCAWTVSSFVVTLSVQYHRKHVRGRNDQQVR